MGTATPSGRHNTRYSVKAGQHWGMNIELGTYTASTAYTTGTGDLTTFGIGNPLAVFFNNPCGPESVAGLTLKWNSTGSGVMVFGTTIIGATTGNWAEGVASTDYSTQALNVPYMAIGFRPR